MGAGPIVVLGTQQAAEERLHAQQIEVVAGRLVAPDPDALGRPRPQVQWHHTMSRKARQHVVAIAVVAIIGYREIRRGAAAQRHEPVGGSDGQRTQDEGVQCGEDRGGRADAEAEREHRRSRQARRTAQAARREAKVAPHLVDDADATRIAALLLALLDAVERSLRRVLRLLRRPAAGPLLSDLARQVEADLIVEVLFDPASTEDRSEPERNGVEPVLPSHRRQASSSRTTWEIAEDRRSHWAVSFWRCRRPSLVSA